MADYSKILCVFDLVKSNASLNTIVHMMDTTIRKVIPDYLEFADYLLDLTTQRIIASSPVTFKSPTCLIIRQPDENTVLVE